MRLRLGPGALGFVLGALMTGLAVGSAHADASWDSVAGGSPKLGKPMPSASVVVATPTHRNSR
ncbi:MAG TPA: hypothetical protein VGL23_05730 [Chloroflexota bacterium]|jgi:hypothetical protein